MKNKDYEVLLNENYIEEVYRLILIDYIDYYNIQLKKGNSYFLELAKASQKKLLQVTFPGTVD